MNPIGESQCGRRETQNLCLSLTPEIHLGTKIEYAAIHEHGSLIQRNNRLPYPRCSA